MVHVLANGESGGRGVRGDTLNGSGGSEDVYFTGKGSSF
jgi:hypothetical protein